MNQEMEDFVGQVLGQFELIEVLGRGGMAVVYRARQVSTNRLAAVKVLPPQLLHNADFYERFEREIEIISHLEHPHIVPIYDYGKAERVPYIVMRYLAGGSLEQHLPLTPQQLDQLISQIAQALTLAHQRGIVHRDLKPGNILMDENGNAYLSDFGIARVLDSNLTGNVLIGTPTYMSPEQASGAFCDARSDIYSLGIVLFECLTGQKPFTAETPLGIVMKHINAPIPLVRSLRADIAPEVEAVVAKATAKHPAERYDSVEEMAKALRDALRKSSTTPGEEKTFVLRSKPAPAKMPGMKQTEHRNRDRLLDKVSAFWVQGVLVNSIHDAALLELGLVEKPTAVERPWDMVLQQFEQPDRLLPHGARILDVYDEMDGELLILGEPGSGKTTMLLELCRELIARARADDTNHIPVVFNLSSWADAPEPIEKWLVDELNTKYQIPSKVGKGWVDQDQILPLLDGLDEVRQEQRIACVDAINHFRSDHGFLPMVVSSRLVDYETLSKRLRLQGAVVLQPLSIEQIDAYFAQLPDDMASVRATLHNDTALLALMKTPLMLNIVALAYRELPDKFVFTTGRPEEYRGQIFDAYIGHMLKRRGISQRYTPQQTVRWLAWLAQTLQREGQSVFRIEQARPGWLSATWQRVVYHLLIPDLGLVPLMLVSWLVLDPRLPLLFSVGMGAWHVYTIVRIRDLVDKTKIIVAETVRWSWLHAVQGFLLGVAGSGLFGAGFALIFEILRYRTPTLQVLLGFGFFTATFLGLPVGIICGMVQGVRRNEVPVTTRPNQGIRQAITNGLRVGSLFGLFSIVLTSPIWLSGQPLNIFLASLITMLLACAGVIVFGGRMAMRHLILRLLLTRNGDTPLNYARFLDYGAERVFLRKVGGGYVFVHRLLLDHFAAMQPPKHKRKHDHMQDTEIELSTIVQRLKTHGESNANSKSEDNTVVGEMQSGISRHSDGL